MKVYILRHAIAENRRPNLSESKRRLTPEGKKELDAVLKALSKMKVKPDLILSSPFVRAWDTAVVAASVLLPHAQPVAFDALKPDGTPARIWTDLKQFGSASSLMLVGHRPLLNEFAAFLLGAPQVNINIKKSGVVRIDLAAVRTERPAGELRWLLTPKQLSRIAKSNPQP